MFSNALVALLFAIGGGGWIYAKINRQTGGNTRSSLIFTGVAAFLIFLVVVIIMGMIHR